METENGNLTLRLIRILEREYCFGVNFSYHSDKLANHQQEGGQTNKCIYLLNVKMQ